MVSFIENVGVLCCPAINSAVLLLLFIFCCFCYSLSAASAVGFIQYSRSTSGRLLKIIAAPRLLAGLIPVPVIGIVAKFTKNKICSINTLKWNFRNIHQARQWACK
ncbi:hypothetical protein P8452_22848 [Trifolium repens]|nr:hypothetical protein P8452_22848 [Trifolium repens]